jgi:hypothetical protein
MPTTDPDLWKSWAWTTVHETGLSSEDWVLNQAHPSCKEPLVCWATLLKVERDALAIAQGKSTPSEITGRPLTTATEVRVELEGHRRRAAEALAWGD